MPSIVRRRREGRPCLLDLDRLHRQGARVGWYTRLRAILIVYLLVHYMALGAYSATALGLADNRGTGGPSPYEGGRG